jgi:hypothetical protein
VSVVRFRPRPPYFQRSSGRSTVFLFVRFVCWSQIRLMNLKGIYMRIIFVFIGSILLAGCLATTDMVKDRGALPAEYRQIALKMVDLAQLSCIKISGTQDKPKDEWSKGIKLDGDWIIRRFFTSNTNWFKAEATSIGVWDSIYFNSSTNQFVCGDFSWGKYSNASSITFSEYGAKGKMLINEPNEINRRSPSASSVNTQADAEISNFRRSGLTQIKYADDASLCGDIKFSLEVLINKKEPSNAAEGLRLLKISELFSDLNKYSGAEKVFNECRVKYFTK